MAGNFLPQNRSQDDCAPAQAVVPQPDAAAERHVDVLIIGAGFGGLCMGIKLREMGLSFVIVERAQEVGGTWRDNTYPGCGCDIPSHLYSFSFEPNPDWSRSYPDQAEILAYLRGCADKYQLRQSILFGTEVIEAVFDEDSKVWRVRTRGQEVIIARAVVSAMGSLSRPAIPKIAGMERFRGRIFHSAQWDHSFDLTGKKVAVIGTGASAVQFIPKIAPQVEKLCVFQRRAPWILPKLAIETPTWLKRLFRLMPWSQRALRSFIYLCQEVIGLGLVNPILLYPLKRLALWYLTSKLPEPTLRSAATPDYPFGCKRILLSNNYYDALARENVELLTGAIAEIRETGIVTQDQKERSFDAIILATGFRAIDLLSPLRVLGLNGADLAQVWRHGPKAFFGMTVPGFPNFFMLLGPNTLLGHNSVVFMIEAQVDYVGQALQSLDRRGSASMNLRQDVHTRFNSQLRRRARGTAWTSGCKSWYLDSRGKNLSLWPNSPTRYWLRTRRFSPEDYSFSNR
jgi:cation diffusion facilitator CzcD-associated flavoprotein CzcO